MDYVLLIYAAEDRGLKMSEEQRHAMLQEYGQFTRDVASSGRLGDCAPLESTRTATTVRIRDGKRVVVDGPFAETREHLGGYYVVKTETEADALDLAAKIPDVHGGSIEVRPVMGLPPGYPKGTPTPTSNEAKKEYILLIYDDEASWENASPADQGVRFGRYMEFSKSIHESGSFVEGAPLQPAKTAKTVRIPEASRLVIDGPFAETREQLGGYYRVRAANLDEALDMAARIPAVETGSIEVRPVMDLSAYA
jgi:hypothetical protein